MLLTFPREIGKNAIFCHKDREEIGRTTIGIIWLAIVISHDHPMTPDELWVPEKNAFCRLTFTELSKI